MGSIICPKRNSRHETEGDLESTTEQSYFIWVSFCMKDNLKNLFRKEIIAEIIGEID